MVGTVQRQELKLIKSAVVDEAKLLKGGAMEKMKGLVTAFQEEGRSTETSVSVVSRCRHSQRRVALRRSNSFEKEEQEVTGLSPLK